MPNYESYQVIKEITLDLVAPGLAPVVNVPQYDTKGRVVKVNLVSNSAAYEIESDFEVHAVMSKKDGKSVNNPCVVDGSTVYAVISKQMTVFEGRQMVAISITNNSDVELKAFPFVLNVIRAPSDAESYASEDEHLAFETTYKQVLEAKTAAENAAEAAANSAAAASGSANAASSSAGAAQSSASNAAASAKKSQTNAGAAEKSAGDAKNSEDAAEQAKDDAMASKTDAASSAQAASAALAGVQAIVAGNEAYTKAESDAYFMDVRRSLALYIAATKSVLADQNDVAPLCENFFAALHDGKVYGVEFYKHSTSPVSAGWKTRDNAALVCEPSTNSKAGRDDYVKRALFCPFNVDYTIDAATLEPKISAIEGVFGTYNAKAPAGLIGVMQQGGWVRYYDAGSSFGYEYADERVILSIEAYDDNNSRVNLDLAAGITTTTSNKINTIAWHSGSCDNVLGVDGSPTNCTSGKEPFIIQGIECMVGAYEVYADAIFKLESADGVFKITPWICKKASEITNNAIGSAYKALSYSLTPPTSAGWRYISSMGFDPAHPCANFPDGLDANSNTGYRAGFYSENATNALREWLAVGDLWGGAYAALGCANSGNGLGSAGWGFSGRACGTAGNRGEFAA